MLPRLSPHELLTGIYELNLIRVDIRFIRIMKMNRSKNADIFYDQIYDLYISVNITSLLKRFIICPIFIYSYMVNNTSRLLGCNFQHKRVINIYMDINKMLANEE